MKSLILVLMLLWGNMAFAHQPNVSSVVLSKTEKGQLLLQISSSLTAFQTEVNYHNEKNAYKTPEEFQNLVLAHFGKTFSIIVNETDTLKFVNPIVLLGHETKIVAEITGLPKTVHKINVQSKLFQEIHHSQSALIFLIDGLPTSKDYVLSDENEHEISIALHEGKWELIAPAISSNLKYMLLVLLVVVVAMVLNMIRKRRITQN